MSFNPQRDGHVYWNHIHLAAANAVTPRKRELYMAYLNGLKESFPCEKCRLHLVENLNNFPVEPYGNTNVSLFYHSWKLHDIVNGQLHKPAEQCLTYDQAFSKYFPKDNDHAKVEPQKFMASAPAPPEKCSSCGLNKVENTKQTFNQFQKTAKRTFIAKNG